MVRLGYSLHNSDAVELSLDERRQGTYVIGTTGTGKSTLLKNIIYQDMKTDGRHGLCVLDPHGDLVDELLELVPPNRVEDVILFDPMDKDYAFPLNLLDCDTDDPHQVRWVVSTIMGTLRRLFAYSWGPRLEHVLRHTLLTALTMPSSTFLEVMLLLSNDDYRKEIVAHLTDPVLIQFWKSFPRSFKDQYELTSSTLNKISPFITDITMRHIVGQSHNTLRLKDVIDEGKILFVNLSKGDIGEDSSALLGSVFVNQILIAALQRRSTAPAKRRQFHLVVDEFQNFATESFAILQSEARKYAVDVLVAHQYRDQLDILSKGSTLNVGNLVIFRVNGRDSYDLASQFDNTPPPAETRVEPVYGYTEFRGQSFLVETSLNTAEGKLYHEVEQARRPYHDVEAEMANQLSILPNHEAWCRLIRQEPGKRARLVEREIRTEPTEALGARPSRDIADAIRQRSRHFARLRTEVDREINERTLGFVNPPDDTPPPAEKRAKS